jgi:CHASE2 domain-containing sensor protein
MNQIHHSKIETLKHALHHGYVALVLACVILLVEQHGWLNWLDSLSLRFAMTLSQGAGATASEGGVASKQDQPVVLLISDEMFEKDFGQASPLNRTKLAEILNRIVEQRPAAVAIDLDLSPGPGDEQNQSQLQLDAALISAAKSGTRLVVGTPFPVQTNDLYSLKARWMKHLCEAGVEFGYSFIQSTQGLVLRYPLMSDSIGGLLSNSKREAAVQASPCEQVKKGEQSAAFLSKDFLVATLFDADNLSHQRPINFSYFRSNAPVLLNKVSDADIGKLAGRPVLLGSGFNPNDEFLTPFGPQKGAVIHAAIAFSERQPTKTMLHTMAILLDIVFGIVAGFVFHAMWARYYMANNMASENGHYLPRHYLVARLWLAGSFGVVFLWVAILMTMSAWLLQHNLWGNPGPMIIGVFVKTLLASRPNGHGSPAAKSGPIAMQYADELLFIPFVIWGFIVFFSGH